MEDIFSLKTIPWITEEPINLWNFLEEYHGYVHNVLDTQNEKPNVEEAVADFMHLPRDPDGSATAKKLLDDCSPDLLTVEDELTPQDTSMDFSRCAGRLWNWYAGSFQDGVIPTGADQSLATLKHQAEELNLRETVHDYARLRHRTMKYSGTVRMITDEDNSPEPTMLKPKDKLKRLRDIVINVRIQRPYHKKTHYKKACNRFPSHGQELLVLGSQKLTELRDAIICINDLGVFEDFSDDPDLRHLMQLENNATKFPSGFFYINGVFYDDLRSEHAKHYSEDIMKWAKKHPEIGELRAESMEDTRFLDVKLRLGYPYIYFHQGNCEHIVVFTDVRLHHKYDVQDPQKYPLLRGQASKFSVKCIICSLKLANWIVLNEDRLPVPVAHLCQQCLKVFCYDTKGTKIKNIKVFPFFDEFRSQQKLKKENDDPTESPEDTVSESNNAFI